MTADELSEKLEEIRVEQVRQRGFIRAAETQGSKVIALTEQAMNGLQAMIAAAPSGGNAPISLPSVTPIVDEGWEGGSLTPANGIASYIITENVAVTSNNPRTGSNSVEYTFGGNPDGDAWSELRFSIDNPSNHIWIEWWLYIPANYEHRDATGPDNNKFIIVDWSRTTLTNRWSIELLRPDAGIDPNWSKGRMMWGRGGSDPVSTSENGLWPQPQDVITLADVGNWVQYRMECKRATTVEDSDGLMRFWKDGVLKSEYLGRPVAHSETPQPFREIELLGWSNSGYTETTTFYLDDLKIYNSNPGW